MWATIAFIAGGLIGGLLVWFFAPRPYVDDDIVVEAERIACDLAEKFPDAKPFSDRLSALRRRL